VGAEKLMQRKWPVLFRPVSAQPLFRLLLEYQRLRICYLVENNLVNYTFLQSEKHDNKNILL